MNINLNSTHKFKLFGCSMVVMATIAFASSYPVQASAILSAPIQNSASQNSNQDSGMVTQISDEKRGIFGIFKKSDQESGASPLFLDNPKSTGNSKVTPYNFTNKDKSGGSKRSSSRSSEMSTYEKNLAMQAESRAQRKYNSAKSIENIKAKHASMRAQSERASNKRTATSSSSGSGDEVKKKYVYEPHKLKRNNGSNSRNTIFNSSR